VRLIVNRMPRRPKIQLPELERLMSFPIQATLPNDYRSLAEACMEPRLLAADHPLGAQMAEVAAQLAGLPAGGRKKTRWLSFLN
jgi:hypothetical protein